MFAPEITTCFKWQETGNIVLMVMNAFRKQTQCLMGVEKALQLRNNLLPKKSIWKFYTRLSPTKLSFFKTAGPKMLLLNKEFYIQQMLIK